MRNFQRKSPHLLFLVSVLLALVLSACGSDKGATPTLSIEAIGTSAYQTFTAQMARQASLTPPSDTPSPSPAPTLPPPSPLPTFSLLASPTLASGVDASCNDAAWIADVTIPDKTVLNPGQKFVKTWLVQNTGTCPWTTKYKVTFRDGEQMSGTEAFVPIQVPVGQQTELTVNMKAPTSSGFYYGRWTLEDEQAHRFGSVLTVVIKVISIADLTAGP